MTTSDNTLAWWQTYQVGSGKSSFLLGLIGELWAQGVMELEIEMNRICQNVLCKVKKRCTEVAYVSQQPWIQNLTLRCSDLEILQLYMKRKVGMAKIFLSSEKTYFLVGQWTMQCIIRWLLKYWILMCAIKNCGVFFVLLLCCASHNSIAGARLFCTCSRPDSSSCWGQDSDWRTRGWF